MLTVVFNFPADLLLHWKTIFLLNCIGTLLLLPSAQTNLYSIFIFSCLKQLPICFMEMLCIITCCIPISLISCVICPQKLASEAGSRNTNQNEGKWVSYTKLQTMSAGYFVCNLLVGLRIPSGHMHAQFVNGSWLIIYHHC